jgi:hypothetical protein
VRRVKSSLVLSSQVQPGPVKWAAGKRGDGGAPGGGGGGQRGARVGVGRMLLLLRLLDTPKQAIGAIAYYISSASPKRLVSPSQARVSAASAIEKKSEHRKQASSAARSPLALPIAVRAVVAQRLEKLSISRFHRVRISTVSNAPCVPSGPPWMPSLVVEPLYHLRRYTSPSDGMEPVAWAKKKKIPSSSALRGSRSSHTRLPGHHVCRPVAMHRLVLCLLITAPGLKLQYALPRLLPAYAVSSPVSTSSCLGA